MTVASRGTRSAVGVAGVAGGAKRVAQYAAVPDMIGKDQDETRVQRVALLLAQTLVGGQKVAGILTEMEGEADRIAWLVAGIGVNANVDVTALPDGATALEAARGEPVDRRRFVGTLLERFAALAGTPDKPDRIDRGNRMDRGDRMDRILPAWREHTSTLGRRVRVDTPGGEVVGEAVDVRFPGTLVVDTGDERVDVTAGDCEHLRPLS